LPVGGLVALVAAPAVGKSALALQWIVAALESDPDLRAVWAAGEMTMAGIGGRLVAVGSGIVGGCQRVRKDDAGLPDDRVRQARAAVAASIGDRLTFVEPSLTVAKMDAAVVSTGAKILMVDYLQLVTVPDGGRDRVADLDRTIGGIRDIATRRECAVIVASSMSKVSGTTSRAGQLARGSAELDYAADLIFLGDHDGVDDKGNPVKASDGTTGVAWRCKKNRNGEQRDLVLRFNGDYQTYNGPYSDFDAWASGATA
jgi:replicative DNA helicase